MKYVMGLILLWICHGCQTTPSKLDRWVQQTGKLKVLSTTAIIDDLVSQVGGDRIDPLTLIAGAIDPHSYELVKGDDEKLSYAQVVFYNGLGLEHGASLRTQLEKHPYAIALGDKIREEKPSSILYDRGQVDPHIWLDISLWLEIIDPIVDALSTLDPQGQAYYAQNGARLKETLRVLDASCIARLEKIAPNKRYLVTSHDAFNYFTRRYLGDGSGNWKERFCAPEGLAPDGQLSCHDIQLVIDHLSKYRIHVIFPEANVGRDSLKKILSVCAEKGLDVKLAEDSLYSDTLGASGTACDTYPRMMEHNVEVLCTAWK